MTPFGRVLVGLLLAGTTLLLFGVGSFAVDPAIGPWGLVAPLLFALAAGSVAIPMYRLTSPSGRYRWLAVAVQLVLPIYLAVAAIHFYVTW